MEFLNEFILPVVLGICLCAGYIIKQWAKDIDNKYIPTIVAILGIGLALWANGWQATPETILAGLVSGLSSTGLHQLLKESMSLTVKNKGGNL